MRKTFNTPYKEALRERILAASGVKRAGLVLKGAKVLNVFTRELEEADVAVQDGFIVGIGAYRGEEEHDLTGRIICPGFIDGHIHLESSMVRPEEFERAVLPHGTTAVVTDPHEIANVAGTEGIEYMLRETEGLLLMCMLCFLPAFLLRLWRSRGQFCRQRSFGVFMTMTGFWGWQS